MIENNTKLQIYKGMIQYLLASTPYTLKNIADLSNASLKHIRSIYDEDKIPAKFSCELQLVRLYQMVLEFNVLKVGG